MDSQATGDQPSAAEPTVPDAPADAAIGDDRGPAGDPGGRWWRGGGPVQDDVRHAHTAFEREAAARLRRIMRAEVQLSLAGAEWISFGEWLSSHAAPVVFALVELPGTVGMSLAVDMAFGLCAVDRLLGGVGGQVPERELTELEFELVGDVLSAPVSTLTEVFGSLLTSPPQLSLVTTQPRMLRAIPAADMMLVLTYDVATDITADHQGTLSLCYPEDVVTPMLERVQAAPAVAGSADLAGDPALVDLMGDIEVDLIARLRPSRFAADDLRRLRIGDVLSLDHRRDDAIELSVSDAIAMAASLGRCGPNLAVRVERWTTPAVGTLAKEFAP